MSAEALQHRTLTVEEYLALEEASPVKHEFVAGVMYALAGASRRHNRIAGNVYRRLADAGASGPCRAYIGDVKLRTAAEVFYYPDVMVACGPEGSDPLVEDAPCLVVEVASPSTSMIDQREKLAAYRSIPTVQAYLIVEQDRRRVRHFSRADNKGQWFEAEFSDGGAVPLPCPPMTLTLDQIYEGVEPPSS